MGLPNQVFEEKTQILHLFLISFIIPRKPPPKGSLFFYPKSCALGVSCVQCKVLSPSFCPLNLSIHTELLWTTLREAGGIWVLDTCCWLLPGR